jgi:dephospho-CoA kinase
MKAQAKKTRPPIIGLTGGIGMGKSTAAAILREMGLPVYHADGAVHDLLAKGGKAVKPVARLFPETLRRGAIDRKRLGHIVFNHPGKLRKLEKILHPLVRQAEHEFLQKARQRKARAAILEIPLLFETGADKRCDYVICVAAPKAVQAKRVLHRPGMTAKKLKAIRARQWPDTKKRKHADFTVDTGGSLAATRRRLRAVLGSVLGDDHA